MNIPVAHPDFLSYRVKRLHMLVAQRLNDVLKPYGLARSQWQVLSRVSRAGVLSQRELQLAMQVEPATLTGIIDALAAKGWIERTESEQDKRCRVLHLTDAGRDKMASIPDPHEIVETQMVAGLSEKDRAAVERALTTMIRNLEERS